MELESTSMRTRQGGSPKLNLCAKRTIEFPGQRITNCQKRLKLSPEISLDFFGSLPDDLVVSILCKLSSSADCPADFSSILITCKRLNHLADHSIVLSKARPKTFAVKARNWCDASHRFLKKCADAGNVEASYTLGMIHFYCLQQRGSGASLMAKAAMNSHAEALYSLAVIHFNGSGSSRNDKHLRAGVALCAKAASLGNIDALRELGHCLQDGYGVHRNVTDGRRFLIQANTHELATSLSTSPATALKSISLLMWNPLFHHNHVSSGSRCPLLSDFGCNVPASEPHPTSQFLTDWFATRGNIPGPGLQMCSHKGCGRPETRRHEFRRCSVCGVVNYCSRTCQALDWKRRHKAVCAPQQRWAQFGDGEGIDVGVLNGNGDFQVNHGSDMDES